METRLVRLKPYDPRRGYVLRRFTFAGIRFQGERGWYRVEMPVADYLRSVREVAGDPHSPLAFDVCTDAEAEQLETAERESAKVKRSSTDDLKVVPARPVGPAIAEEPQPDPPATRQDSGSRRGRRE